MTLNAKPTPISTRAPARSKPTSMKLFSGQRSSGSRSAARSSLCSGIIWLSGGRGRLGRLGIARLHAKTGAPGAVTRLEPTSLVMLADRMHDPLARVELAALGDLRQRQDVVHPQVTG